jgi:putative flavoprotein involved in K+ transport
MGTSGSEGGQQKPTSRKTGRALLSDPYTHDNTWIDIPGVIDKKGRIRQSRGLTPSPGLYTLGLTWQHTRGSALLGWVGNDAAFLAQQIGAITP